MNQASCRWKKALIGAVPAMGLLMIGTVSVAADPKGKLPQTAYLPQEMALQAATTALEQCRADGYNVSVAVVDRAGVLLALVRDPAAGPHTIGSSQGKAFTSASTGQITANMAQAISENPVLSGLRDMDARMVVLGGGLPIIIEGQRLGGIGVGGAPGGHLDAVCALAGLKKIGAQI